MRKWIAFLSAVMLTVSFAGCGNKNDDATVSSSVTYFDGESTKNLSKADIDAAVAKGELTISFEAVEVEAVTQTTEQAEIVEATMKLGMEAVDFTTAVKRSGYDETLHRKIGENYIRYECGSSMTAYGYFTNDDRKNGLASLVYYGTSYGFEPTVTTVTDVKKVMGTPAVEAAAPEKAMQMFLFFEPGYTYLDYQSGNNHVSFFFHENGTLGATVLYQNDLWIY